MSLFIRALWFLVMQPAAAAAGPPRRAARGNRLQAGLRRRQAAAAAAAAAQEAADESERGGSSDGEVGHLLYEPLLSLCMYVSKQSDTYVVHRCLHCAHLSNAEGPSNVALFRKQMLRRRLGATVAGGGQGTLAGMRARQSGKRWMRACARERYATASARSFEQLQGSRAMSQSSCSIFLIIF